jgi:hypothetical protein
MYQPFPFQGPPKFTKIGLKIYHLATMSWARFVTEWGRFCRNCKHLGTCLHWILPECDLEWVHYCLIVFIFDCGFFSWFTTMTRIILTPRIFTLDGTPTQKSKCWECLKRTWISKDEKSTHRWCRGYVNTKNLPKASHNTLKTSTF